MNPHQHARARTRPALQPWHAWLLAALLLTAQALGLAHRIEHAPGSAQRLHALGVAAQGGTAAAGAAWSAAGQGSDTHGMAAHQAGDADCRLVDQLAHADGLADAAAGLPAVLPTPVLALTPAAPVAVPPLPAAYQARAPPQA